MKLIFFIALFASLVSCKNTNTDKQIPNQSNRASVEQEIVGIWELLKRNYQPTEEPKLINPNNKEYLEIKKDGTCQDDRYEAKWFLSYTDDFVIDSTSKVIFTELFNFKPNEWGEYNRTLKSYKVKVATENNTKYLYLTSLQSSSTKIYIRKT